MAGVLKTADMAHGQLKGFNNIRDFFGGISCFQPQRGSNLALIG